MKKRFVFLIFVICLFFVFNLSVYAASDDTIYVDTIEEFDSVSDSVATQVVNSVNPLPTSTYSSNLSKGSSSFVPSLTFEGVDYPYNSKAELWMDEVSYGMNVQHDYNSSNNTAFSLTQINNKHCKFVLSGFESDSTYTGVLYFQIQTKRASKSNVNLDYIFSNASGTSFSEGDVGKSLLTDFLVSSISCKDSSGSDVPVYYSRILDDSKTYYTFTFYVILQDYYVGPSNGIVDVNNVVIDIDFFIASQMRYYLLTKSYTPLSYYSIVNRTFTFLSRSFSGTVTSGRHNFDSNYSESIAATQASIAESQHNEIVNGYDNSTGNAANNSLESGLASYESEEAQAHNDFNEKMDSYTNPDTSDYVSGISFISSAVVMWWNGLGMFKIILLVGFSLIIFNYISRYRGG